MSSLEEDVTKEVDTDSDDDDYVPSVCLQYALFCVSADTTLFLFIYLFFVLQIHFLYFLFLLQDRWFSDIKNICLESLPVVSMEVHDAVDPSHDSTSKEPPLPEAIKIIVDDDVIGHPASIVYHDCLRQLAEYIVLPMSKCTAKDPVTKQQCCAQALFEMYIKSRGTAVVVEWVSW